MIIRSQPTHQQNISSCSPSVHFTKRKKHFSPSLSATYTDKMRLTHTSALCVTLCITGVIDSFDEGDERCTLHNIRIILADLLGLDRDVFKTKLWKKFIKKRVLIHMKARLGLCSPPQASFSHPYVPADTTLYNLNSPDIKQEAGSLASRRSTNSPSTGSEPTPDPSDHLSRLTTPCHAQSSSMVILSAMPSCSRIIKTEDTGRDSTDPPESTSSSLSRSDIRPAIQRARCSESRDYDLDFDVDASVSLRRTEARVNNIILDVCRQMEKRHSRPMMDNPLEDCEENVKMKILEIKREPEVSNKIPSSHHDCDSNDGDDSGNSDDEREVDHDQDRAFSPRKTRSEKRTIQDTSFSKEQDQKRSIKRQGTSETRPKTRTCTIQEEIKLLRRLIRGAGIRKNWAREFRGREHDLKWQICHLQTIVHDIKTRKAPYTVRMNQKIRSLELAARKAERRDAPSELEGEILKISPSESPSLSRASLVGSEKATNVKTWKGWRYIMVDDEGNELPDAIWEAPTKQGEKEQEV